MILVSLDDRSDFFSSSCLFLSYKYPVQKNTKWAREMALLVPDAKSDYLDPYLEFASCPSNSTYAPWCSRESCNKIFKRDSSCRGSQFSSQHPQTLYMTSSRGSNTLFWPECVPAWMKKQVSEDVGMVEEKIHCTCRGEYSQGHLEGSRLSQARGGGAREEEKKEEGS